MKKYSSIKEKDIPNITELEFLSRKFEAISSRFKAVHLKSREKTRKIDAMSKSIFIDLADVKDQTDKHTLTAKHCTESIDQIQFYFSSMKKLKICKEDIVKISLEPKTIDKYIENAKTIDMYIKFFQANSPIFPDLKEWEILHIQVYEILSGYIINFLEQDLETNIDYIIDVVNSWVISGLRPFQDDFIKRRTDNLSDGVLDKIVNFMRENGKYNTNDVHFTNRRRIFYENIISFYKKENINYINDDKKSTRSANSNSEKRKSLKKPPNIRLCDLLFQSQNSENQSEHLTEDFMIVSKIYAMSLLVLKMDICSVEKVYAENARKDINSSLLVHFWNMVLEIIENAHNFINKVIKLYTLEGCLKVMGIILPILAFFCDNQDRALELCRYCHHAQMELFILNLTKPLEDVYFEAFKSFDNQLKDKSVYDFLKTNEWGIDEKIVIIKEFISYIHVYSSIAGYICAKNKMNLEFSKFEESGYVHLRAITEPLIAKYVTYHLSAMNNISFPKKEIYSLNQSRYILESIEDGILNNLTLPNTIIFYKKQVNEMIESTKNQYLKYWEKGIEPLKTVYEKLKDSIIMNRLSIIDLKSKDKALVKNAFVEFKDFLKKVPEDHENINFYNGADIACIKKEIVEKIVKPYGEYCEIFSVLSKKKTTKDHIKVWKENILIVIENIFKQ